MLLLYRKYNNNNMPKYAQMRANKRWREANKEYFNEMRKPIQKNIMTVIVRY